MPKVLRSLLEAAGLGRLWFSIKPPTELDGALGGLQHPDQQKQPRRRSALRRGASITSLRNDPDNQPCIPVPPSNDPGEGSA
jgi:hypothetical protein